MWSDVQVLGWQLMEKPGDIHKILHTHKIKSGLNWSVFITGVWLVWRKGCKTSAQLLDFLYTNDLVGPAPEANKLLWCLKLPWSWWRCLSLLWKESRHAAVTGLEKIQTTGETSEEPWKTLQWRWRDSWREKISSSCEGKSLSLGFYTQGSVKLNSECRRMLLGLVNTTDLSDHTPQDRRNGQT